MLVGVMRVIKMRLCYNRIMSKRVKSGGFTLVELSLAMTFIGILSIIVVLLIQNVSASYRRGLTLNQINTVGMDVIDDLKSSVRNSSSDAVDKLCEIEYGYADNSNANWKNCKADHAMAFTYLKKTANVVIDKGTKSEKTIANMPIYGVICTGTYTYVWNSGYLFTGSTDAKVTVDGKSSYSDKQKLAAKVNSKVYRLAKIYDNEKQICIAAANKYNKSYNSSKYTKSATINDSKKLVNSFTLNLDNEISADESKDPIVELLTKNSNLVVYDLFISPPAVSLAQGNLFYSGSMILGTMNGGINIAVAGNSCKPPNDTSGYEDLQYCAINKFNFAMEAGGK